MLPGELDDIANAVTNREFSQGIGRKGLLVFLCRVRLVYSPSTALACMNINLKCFLKHQLEDHLSGDTVGRGIRPSESSFSNTRWRVYSFCGFSPVPAKVHHHLGLCFCWTNLLTCICVCMCVRQEHTLPLYSFLKGFLQNGFSLLFLHLWQPFSGWVPPSFSNKYCSTGGQQVEYISTAVSRECC